MVAATARERRSLVLQQLEFEHGAVYRSDDPPASELRCLDGGRVDLPKDAAHFGFVQEGMAILRTREGSFVLRAGMYFRVSGEASFDGPGSAIVASRIGHDDALLLGGPIAEAVGLRDDEGFSDSPLIASGVAGDPHLNHLHLQADVSHAWLRHPGICIGIVARGTGRCEAYGACGASDESIALEPGTVFAIAPQGEHRFVSADDALDIVVYHPGGHVAT